MACRACGLLLDGRTWQPGFARLEGERAFEGVPGRFDAGIGWVRLVVAPEGADRRLGDTELDISVEVRVVGRVHLRDQRLVARFEYQDVQVRWPEGVAVSQMAAWARRLKAAVSLGRTWSCGRSATASTPAGSC